MRAYSSKVGNTKSPRGFTVSCERCSSARWSEGSCWLLGNGCVRKVFFNCVENRKGRGKGNKCVHFEP